MKMHEASISTVHTVVNDDNKDTNALAEHLNREGSEDEIGKVHA